MIRLFAGALTALIILVFLVSSVTSAQDNRGAAPSRGPGWLPRTSHLPAAEYKVTASELTTVINRLTEIERLFVQVDEVARPVGFEIEPSFYGFSPNESVLSYRYDAMFYSPSKKAAGEGTACFWAEINHHPGANQTGYHDETGAEMTFEEPQGTPLPGATHVWKDLSPTLRSVMDILFTSGKVSPMEPVTRERYLKAIILSDGEREAQTRRVTSQSSYDAFMANAANRKAARDGIRLSLPAAQAAPLIKTMEDDERKVAAELKASEASERAESARLIAVYTQSVARARAQLAAMSPAERNTPGWLERNNDVLERQPAGNTVFAGPTTPNAGRLVIPRSDMLKGRPSHIDPRLLHVHLSASLTCNRPVVQKAIYQVYKKLDWAALARVVNP